MINTGLKNKVAIVTGANHGIGAATAIAFAQEGAKVFINYLRQSPELYGETKERAERATTPGRAYYCKMISRSASVELGPYGITVNVISPGAVQTGWMPKELEKKLAESYPLRRIGKPEDIAKAVIFFASQQADWITGQVLYVGGGNRM